MLYLVACFSFLVYFCLWGCLMELLYLDRHHCKRLGTSILLGIVKLSSQLYGSDFLLVRSNSICRCLFRCKSLFMIRVRLKEQFRSINSNWFSFTVPERIEIRGLGLGWDFVFRQMLRWLARTNTWSMCLVKIKSIFSLVIKKTYFA